MSATMKKPVTKLRPAGWCWLGLSIYVISADTFLIIKETRGHKDYCTMSTSFREALSHPIKRWPVIVMWIGLTFHLFDFFFPEHIKKYEPIRLIGTKIVVKKPLA